MIKNTFKSYTLIFILTVVFSLGSTLPLGILSLIFPALLVALLGYTVTRHHYTFVGVICALLVILYSLFTKDFLSGIYLAIEIILYGLTLGIGYNLKISEFKITGVLTVIYSLFVVLNIKFTGSGENLRADIASSMESIYSLYQNQLSQADFKTIISTLLDVFMRFLPSLIICVGICFALFYFWIFKKVLKISKTDTLLYTPFSELHADKSISITFFVLSIIGFFLPSGTYLGDAFMNITTVASFVFLIYGLSYVDFILKHKMKNKLSRRILLIAIVFASLTMLGIPCFMLTALGAMDGCFDYRKRLNKQ